MTNRNNALRARSIRAGLMALALPATLALAACGTDETVTEDGTMVSNETLAQMVSGAENASILAGALEESGLATVFDTAAAYTVLAPTDDAFGNFSGGELDGAQEAAILRSHILPGSMTMEDISGALDSAGGEVSVAAMDGSDVTFTQLDEGIEVSGADGTSAMLLTENRGSNGVVITIDKVLKPRPES